jgi:hypothetical protein
MTGFDQPPRHVRAHIAETDETDVHGINPSPNLPSQNLPSGRAR